MILRAARHALRQEMPRRVRRFEAVADAELSLVSGPNGAAVVSWDGSTVGRLRAGGSTLRPLVDAIDEAFLDGPHRERVRVRLQNFVDAAVRSALAPLFVVLGVDDPALRGVLYRIGEGLGLTAEGAVPALRPRLEAVGVAAGRHAQFVPAILRPKPNAMRALLWGIANGVAPPDLPPPGRVSFQPSERWPTEFAAVMGWIQAGPVWLRVDIAEKLSTELTAAAQNGPVSMPSGLATRLSLKAGLLPSVLRALGFRLLPAPALGAADYGPPSPPRIGVRRRQELPAAAAAQVGVGGPFAALGALRAQ